MVKFQDVLQQRHLENGAPWCDEGVYHIAKDLQLLYYNKSTNNFLGLGRFHMEKVLLCVIGQFLYHMGDLLPFYAIFLQNKIYGPFVTDNKTMISNNYTLSRQAFRIKMKLLVVFSSQNLNNNNNTTKFIHYPVQESKILKTALSKLVSIFQKEIMNLEQYKPISTNLYD